MVCETAEELQARLALRAIWTPSARPVRSRTRSSATLSGFQADKASRPLCGEVQVQIIEGSRMEEALEPYVRVSVGKSEQQTKVGSFTSPGNPRWDESPFSFQVDTNSPDRRTICLEVCDAASNSGARRIIGRLQMLVRKLVPGSFEEWLQLQTGVGEYSGPRLQCVFTIKPAVPTPIQAAEAIAATIIQFSGCNDKQTSADVSNTASFGIGGRGAGGACTCSLIKALQSNPQPSWVGLLKDMRRILKEDGYKQIPQLCCSKVMDLNDPMFLISRKPQGRFRSVLVGINYIGTESQLSGCQNDVRQMQEHIAKYGFTRDDQWVLMDDGAHDMPSLSNISRAMNWLVEGAKEGDSLFFHYSGHGTRMQDTTGDEKDGYDEAMVPVDYQYAGMLKDDEVHSLLVEPLVKGVHLVCVMDCCHSGTILDLPYRFDANDDKLQNMTSGETAAMPVNEKFNLAALEQARQKAKERMEEAAYSNSLFHRQLKAEVDDVLKVGLTKRLERLEKQVQKLLGDSTTGATRSAGGPKFAESGAGPDATEPRPAAALSHSHAQTNEDVDLTPHPRMAQAFEKALVIACQAAKQPQKCFEPSRRANQCRLVDPPDKEERIERETTTLNSTLGCLRQQCASRERQIVSLKSQVEACNKMHEEQKGTLADSKASLERVLSNPGSIKEVHEDRLARRKKRIAEFTAEVKKTRLQGERYQELAQQQRQFLVQGESVDARGGKEVIKWHSAGEVFLVPRPAPVGDEKTESWDVGSAIANPYVVDSWPFEPNVMARRTSMEVPMSCMGLCGSWGPMFGHKEETQEDLRAEQRRLPNLNLRLPQPDSDDEGGYSGYQGPSETSRSM